MDTYWIELLAKIEVITRVAGCFVAIGMILLYGIIEIAKMRKK